MIGIPRRRPIINWALKNQLLVNSATMMDRSGSNPHTTDDFFSGSYSWFLEELSNKPFMYHGLYGITSIINDFTILGPNNKVQSLSWQINIYM